MAARKKVAPKAAPKKKSAASGAKKKSAATGGKKKSAATGGKKKAAAKAAPEKKAAPKRKPAPRKKAVPKKEAAAPRAEEASREMPSAVAEARSETPAPDGGGVSSLAVNLGHVFALRPRVETSFRPDDLRAARQQLRDESYPTLEEAARAVAAKALELTRDAGRRGRR